MRSPCSIDREVYYEIKLANYNPNLGANVSHTIKT